MTNRTLPVALATLLAAATLAACSSSGGGAGQDTAAGGDAGQPTVTATPTPTAQPEARSLPLMAYMPSEQDALTVARASALLVQDCMRRIGFGGYKADAGTTPAKAPAAAGEFGYLDEEQAARYGFRNAQSVKGKPADAARADPAEIAALSGSDPGGRSVGANVPQGGCGGEASRKLGEGLAKPAGSVYDDLNAESYQRTRTDSRVTAAIRAWADCMKQKGFNYSSPQALSTEAWGASVTQREIDTAKADVACTRQSNLAGIAFAVQSALQQQQISGHQQQLQAEKDYQQSRVRKAAEVLRGHGL